MDGSTVSPEPSNPQTHDVRRMRYGSLFTGAGGFDKALDRAGMSCAWQVEIDRQCRSVLARHWPDVPRYDDVRRVLAYLEKRNAKREFVRPERPELLCGGFPCQDISVAGRRAGLAGGRSGLWFTFRRIAALLRPRWLLIENVDGLRSSNRGRDLGIILRALGDMGYGWAYRVFDSQWFGLAQRRERVFIVGCLGSRTSAAEILFEPDCLPWDSPPSRETGERVAASLTRGSASGRGVNEPGRRREDDVNLAYCPQITGTIQANCGTKQWLGNQEAFSGEYHIAHTLRAEGFDASEDGTGRGTPIVPIDMRQASRGATFTNNRPGGSSGGAPGTGIGEPGDPSFTVCESHVPAICFSDQRGRDNDTVYEELAGTLHAAKGQSEQQAVAFQTRIARNGRGQPKEITDALTSCEGGGHADSKPHVAGAFGVRRLTPRECERLQGFDDDWTRWDADGNELADSPRYRMMGNAVSIPPVEWIGQRIVEATEHSP